MCKAAHAQFLFEVSTHFAKVSKTLIKHKRFKNCIKSVYLYTYTYSNIHAYAYIHIITHIHIHTHTDLREQEYNRII